MAWLGQVRDVRAHRDLNRPIGEIQPPDVGCYAELPAVGRFLSGNGLRPARSASRKARSSGGQYHRVWLSGQSRATISSFVVVPAVGVHVVS